MDAAVSAPIAAVRKRLVMVVSPRQIGAKGLPFDNSAGFSAICVFQAISM
jgi:hypothetical protein